MNTLPNQTKQHLATSDNIHQTIIENQSTLPDQPHANQFIFAKIRRAYRDSPIVSQILKFVFYAAFGVAFYLIVWGPKVVTHYSIQERIINGEEILINKNIRGIFPPLVDDERLLIAKWTTELNSASLSTDKKVQAFSSEEVFNLEFKKNGNLYITKDNCKGDIRMHWKNYFGNLIIKEETHLDEKQSNNVMVISNSPEDEACIKGNSTFIEDLKWVSVWTVYEDKLFFLIENNQKDLLNEILIARKIYNPL